MSTDGSLVPEDDTIGTPDLLDLPMFGRLRATDAQRANRTERAKPARVRSDFVVTKVPPPRPLMHLVPPPEAKGESDAVQILPDTEDLDGLAMIDLTGGEEPLNWGLVAVFRQQCARQLSERLSGTNYVEEDEKREMGRGLIVEAIELHAAERVTRGDTPWTARFQQRMAEAVFNALFRMGRLQPLLDLETVENITIMGYDRVVLEFMDGTLQMAPPVADSDAELIEFLQFLASRSESNARVFSENHPALHMRLDGGERLAANAWTVHRPSINIRRHRLRHVRLEDLVALGTLSPLAASFLAAAVRARRSIVVAGNQGAGKTTLMRALCAEIDPWEPIGTFETEYELGLHEMPEAHKIVHAWEARPGTGELDAAGRRAGEYSMSEQLIDSFRMNLTRQIVGEVRGPEVWPMIKAMESAPGSMCTTHAKTAKATIPKLVGCAMEAGHGISYELAQLKLAQAVDIVVHMHSAIHRTADAANRVRYVSEIVAIGVGEQGDGPGFSSTTIFRHVPGRGAVANVLPDDMRDDLVQAGFDITTFNEEVAMNRAQR